MDDLSAEVGFPDRKVSGTRDSIRRARQKVLHADDPRWMNGWAVVELGLGTRPEPGNSIRQSWQQVKPPTGEPCAGDPHARFGGEGDRELNRSSLPLSGRWCPIGEIQTVELIIAINRSFRMSQALGFAPILLPDAEGILGKLRWQEKN